MPDKKKLAALTSIFYLDNSELLPYRNFKTLLRTVSGHVDEEDSVVTIKVSEGMDKTILGIRKAPSNRRGSIWYALPAMFSEYSKGTLHTLNHHR